MTKIRTRNQRIQDPRIKHYSDRKSNSYFSPNQTKKGRSTTLTVLCLWQGRTPLFLEEGGLFIRKKDPE